MVNQAKPKTQMQLPRGAIGPRKSYEVSVARPLVDSHINPAERTQSVNRPLVCAFRSKFCYLTYRFRVPQLGPFDGGNLGSR